jgi:hypothetical protein
MKDGSTVAAPGSHLIGRPRRRPVLAKRRQPAPNGDLAQKRTEYAAQTTAPSPEHRADASKPALRRSHAVGPALQGAGREGKTAMSHARGRARLGRALRKSERAQARSLYPQSHCTTPQAETTVSGAKTTDQGRLRFGR